MAVNVRVATPADEDALYRLLLGLERDNTLGYEHNEDRVRQHIKLGTEKTGGVHGVIDAPDRPGELAGSVGIVWNQLWYSDEWFWHELWLFVDPEYRRGTGYGDALMEWAKHWHDSFCDKMGREVPFFTSVSSRKRLKTKMRWWQKRGEQVGAIYLLR